MLAIGGIFQGMVALSQLPVPEDSTELFEGLGTAAAWYGEIMFTNPYRRPLAAMNVLVSAMVLIGSFMLSWRRSSAMWWLTQAITAKLLWLGAYTALMVVHVYASAPDFADMIDQAIAAWAQEGVTRDQPEALRWMATRFVVGSAVSAVLHAGVLWRATRPDMKKFISERVAK